MFSGAGKSRRKEEAKERLQRHIAQAESKLQGMRKEEEAQMKRGEADKEKKTDEDLQRKLDDYILD